MAKEEGIEMEGVVTEVLPDRNYRVMLENGHEILAYAAGKMSKFKIRVLEGDRVSVVLSPYDLMIVLGADPLRMSVYSEVDPLPETLPIVQVGLVDFDDGTVDLPR